MPKKKLPKLVNFGPTQATVGRPIIENMAMKGPGGKLLGGGSSFKQKQVGGISETELQKRLRKLEKDGSGGGPLVTNVGDNTYEWTDEYTWIVYASDINNASSEGIITSQQDAVDFSFSAISEAGIALGWLGYWTSKSLQQSGDPTDYIWTDLTVSVPASSISLYYTESTSLLPAVGNPTYPGAGITWTSFTGSTPASAFWVATQYTINGTKTPWRIIPVRTKQSDLGLIIYTISGNKPAMNSTQWKANAITAISVFTGNTYSTTNEMGFGTTIGITYDDGKLFGTLKKVSGVATWVTTSTFVDGELLISETVIADKIAANAITTAKLAAGSITSSKLVVSGSGAIGAGTIGAATTFHADDAPTATAIGDLWIDTNDGNRLYRASATGSGNWVSVRDATIATAQTAASTAITHAATAQGTADGKVNTYFQDAAPTGLGDTDAGDLWIDTNDGNKLYRWNITPNPSAWEEIQDDDIAAAIAAAGTAQTTADGKIVSFYQDAVPTTGVKSGDLWIDTNDKNKLYRAAADGSNEITAGEWVSVQDTTVADNIYTSNTTTIDGGRITTGSVTANQVTLVPGDVGAGSAASSGSRMNITTSRIKIYDSGNLRVQLGDLS